MILTERNGRKTLTTVQGLPKKFDQKKILKVIKKKFGESSCGLLRVGRLRVCLACNGTIVNDTEMGEVIQLQGDQRKDVQEFLVDKKEGLELDAKTIKVLIQTCSVMSIVKLTRRAGPWVLDSINSARDAIPLQRTDRGSFTKPESHFLPRLLVWHASSDSVRWALVDTP